MAFEDLFENALVAALVECAFTLVLTYALVRLLKYIIRRIEKNGIHHRFLANALVAAVWIAGVVTALSTIPALSKLSRTLLAGSGIVAVIMGLAAQDSFGNLLSGLFLSLFKPFEIGDRVKLVNHGITGFIEDITLRHTIIRTLTNSRLIIPNSTMNSELIENANHTSQVASSFVDISISYESDVTLAMKIMADVIGSHESYLDQRTQKDIAKGVPKVPVLVRELGESSVGLRASMWTRTIDENFRACSDVRVRLMEAFRKNGIEIPYNRLVVIEKEA